METIGFIGIGVMGRSMAGHLLKAGYKVVVFNRTRAKADSLIETGALWAESPATLAARCEAVITMVGYPSDVEATYLGDAGLVAHAKPGTVLIDMTTSCPELAARIANEAAKRNLHAIDAPVTGGDVGAREAKLSIMVGGEKAAFELALPILKHFGPTVIWQGLAGAGQHAKMCNQIVIAGTMMGVCESLAYAQKSGLDPRTVLQSIGGGAASSWALNNLAPRILDGNFAPGFYVKHFIKDLSIALSSAESLGLDLPGVTLAKQLYERLAANGGADLGTQALYKLYVGERTVVSSQ
ncbi:MAG: NAD(P)-dependent oxidoreductase [Verrucomicrobiota bacterium]|nr:NAD(P)-dependent oxidoreductase [Verrucomicrobiota bacterium]